MVANFIMRMAVAPAVLAVAFTLTAAPARASGIDAPVRIARAAPRANASLLQLAHLDEESLPAADASGSAAPSASGPAPGSDSAPADNSSPGDDWQQVPANENSSAALPPAPVQPSAATLPPATTLPSATTLPPAETLPPAILPSAAGAASTGSNSAPAAGSNSADDAGASSPPAARSEDADDAAPAGAAAGSAAPPAMPSAGGQGTAGAANNPGTPALHNASVEAPENGPPPALDVGTIAAGPDLSDTSLAAEIRHAATPAMAASLRVTEEARKELMAGHPDDAIRDLGPAVSIDPGNPFAYFYLGRSYMAENNYDQALTFLGRAEIGFASRPDWLGETEGFEGACDEELGKLPAAALAYQRAVGAAPANLMARVGYSRLAANLPPPPNPNPPAAPAEESAAPPNGDDAEPAPEELPPPPPPPAEAAPAVAAPSNDSGAD